MELEQHDSLLRVFEAYFSCPISKFPINNPVITPVGITYEKQALEDWLDIKGAQPQSKKPLKKQSLIHNLALKGLVEKIYKEVPKLEKSLIEKSELIASLAQEVADLKKDLHFEKEKNQQIEQLMDCTSEKTRNIRKMHQRKNKESEMEIKSLKEKLKETSKLKIEFSEKSIKQKLIQKQLEESKEKIKKLETKITEDKRISQIRQNMIYLKLKPNRNQSRSQLEKKQFGSYRNAFMHIQCIMESVFKNRQRIADNFGTNTLTFKSMKQIIYLGVDQILQKDQEIAFQQISYAQEANQIEQYYSWRNNEIQIQRFLLHMHQKQDSYRVYSFDFDFEIIKINDSIGYRINFIPPFHLPLSEYKLKIDWSKVISISCSFNQQQWDFLLSQVNRLPNLTELKVKGFTVRNLTSVQLSSMTKLKSIFLNDWSTIDETQTNQIDEYRKNHLDVQVYINHDHPDSICNISINV